VAAVVVLLGLGCADASDGDESSATNERAATTTAIGALHVGVGLTTGSAEACRVQVMLPGPMNEFSGLAGVIVPTHNDGANVGPLLERVLAEPCVGEVVVVASECSDETLPTVLEIAASHEGRVRLYVEAVRSGKAAAINFGLEQTQLPFVIIVSGDVLPAEGALPQLVVALGAPEVGLAGGRPVPVNDENSAIGYAVHLMWRLHHRLALHQPKLGEMIAIRSEAVISLPRTSVDEACFQALLENEGWRSIYVPTAVVANRGPGTAGDFVKQRRQVHTGHLWLKRRQSYTVPSLRFRLLVPELLHELLDDRRKLQPRRLAWTTATVVLEACARSMARLDYLRGREKHVWDMVTSTKDPALGPDGSGARNGKLLEGEGLAPATSRQPDDQYQLPL
jgi:biofilm PGA synthesis N-glycosyltransferase PgaC